MSSLGLLPGVLNTWEDAGDDTDDAPGNPMNPAGWKTSTDLFPSYFSGRVYLASDD